MIDDRDDRDDRDVKFSKNFFFENFTQKFFADETIATFDDDDINDVVIERSEERRR